MSSSEERQTSTEGAGSAKLEFGIDSQSGQPMLIDEVLTPDTAA